MPGVRSVRECCRSARPDPAFAWMTRRAPQVKRVAVHAGWAGLGAAALAVLDAAKGKRLWPYVAVSMLGRIRTEEARVYPCVAPALRVSSHGAGPGREAARTGKRLGFP